jgi:NAD(P)-dependent dehydrogenase (short-subunit alcohol dehydrogenase family)
MTRFKDKVAIATGGGPGIGKAIALAVFLASDEASAVTGQIIPIHCGLQLNF